MRTGYSKLLARALAGLCLALTLFVSADTARADFVDDAIAAIDASQALPFPIAPWKAAYGACVNSNDVVNCMDTFAQANGIKDANTELVFKILSDLQNDDYWSLLADGGEAVACAAAKILTGIPVCDILGGLYDGAKAIYDWFSGLFGGNSYTPNIGETSAYPCLGGQRLMQNGQCSYCPLGQALVGPHDISKVDPKDGTKLDPNYNTCGFCPQPTQSVTQTSDRCWTTSGSTQGTPTVDGSSCNGGGYTNSPVCCKPGSISPVPGTCAPACSPGQVFDTATGACKACGTDANAYYDHPTSSVGKCTCPPFGDLELDANNNCVKGCPVGSTKNPDGSCSPSCAPGQVYDKDNHYCHACSAETVPSYFYGPQSSAGDCASCYNGNVLQNGACVCPAGSALMGPGPRPTCQKCPANFYSVHPGGTACIECADNQVSDPGSHNCHTLSCGAGMHAVNHKCVSTSIIHLLPNTRPPQNR